ncbi:phospholipase A2 inhibitor and Ly6/PLAUR domain-containing protein-like [Rhineura floridana]|uniref:phospholipase A2 inhibitor and Ly6/PLAUR domain-containing protein-like n=1 Tax=Rhineura floridana TaxID=261503 RepID=UPI002AC871D8|nr:phospholipase A2 inhibitor and Ly6/PLAUR domain-containing protein-like [Rhineura floridana]
MKLLLHYFFAALVATGDSLICNCTLSPGCNADGICSVPTGVCVALAQEDNMGGVEISEVYKACQDDSQFCNAVNSVSATKGIYSRTNMLCCNKDMCNAAPIAVPPKNLTENGVSCPACFAIGSDSCEQSETLRCTGDDNHCITVAGSLSRGGAPSSTFAISGCSSTSVCSMTVDMEFSMGDSTFILKSNTCNPAPNPSSG